MSWKPEVVADETGNWLGNALRFRTKEEADRYAANLASRWTSVRDWRSIECDDPVTYEIVGDELRALSGEDIIRE